MIAEFNRQLWCAVIAQAIDDAICLPSKNKARNREIKNARDWLTKPSRDFADVCRLAGYEPDRIRAQVIKRLGEVDASGPAPRDPRYTYDGQSLTLAEWSAVTGVAQGTLRSRMQNGWSIERAMTMPVRSRVRPHQINATNEGQQANVYHPPL